MTTEERFVKLERELSSAKSRIHWLVVAVIIAAVVVVVWTCSSTTNTAQAEGVSNIPSVIRARKFILEDNSGNVRAVLATDKEGTGLTLLDQNGENRIMLGASELGNGLLIFDQNGKVRAVLTTMTNNIPRLVMIDEYERVIWSTESPPEQKTHSSDAIATFSGSGGKNTRPFSVPAGWEIQWDANGDIFQLYLYKADGSLAGIPVNQLGSGKGSSYQASAGKYYLQVNALGQWSIKIVQVK